MVELFHSPIAIQQSNGLKALAQCPKTSFGSLKSDQPSTKSKHLIFIFFEFLKVPKINNKADL